MMPNNENIKIPIHTLIEPLGEKIANLLEPKIIDFLKSNPNYSPSFDVSNDKELINRYETAEILGISLSTLDIWTKQGKLKKYRINSTVRYKRGEVLNSFQSFKKYQR